MDKITHAMAHLSYGIYVITCRRGDEKHGMIASWVSQISHDPPLVIVAVRTNRRIHPILQEAGAFALHVLEKSDKKLIGRFKLPTSAERFQGIECTTAETGSPIIKGALAWMDCALVDSITPGDHTLFIGKALAADCSEGTPMTSIDYGKVYRGDS
ncbi:MAG: hypothetical protein Kow0099_20680 [Candidatus Abyssubacteria bacterium]